MPATSQSSKVSSYQHCDANVKLHAAYG